jgi:hypothetical protein
MIEGFCMSKVANCTDSDNAIWSLLWKLNFDLSLCGVVTLYRSIKICNYKHASQNFIQSVSTNSAVKILNHKRSLGVRLNWTCGIVGLIVFLRRAGKLVTNKIVRRFKVNWKSMFCY